MPRQARKEYGTGIFHVMMRGINHQNIFDLLIRERDEKVGETIKRIAGSYVYYYKSGVTNTSAFQQLSEEARRGLLKELKEQGASHRQLERLTGVGCGLIQRL